MAPMHVNNSREVPEYEIDAKELDFTNSIELAKVISYIKCEHFYINLIGN